jgi:thiol-disulfide isomerase/thioredoxin
LSDPASLLAKRVTSKFKSKVKLLFEDYGESVLNDRYQITGYPTVFLDGIPVALPHDFGFGADVSGKYMPWMNPESQERFARDLEDALALAIKGESFDEYVRDVEAVKNYSTRLPSLSLTDSQGNTIDLSDLSGRVVIIDFWAVWCPPCWRTLPELEALAERYGDKLAVLTIGVDSPADEMEKMRADLSPNLSAIHASKELAAEFGAVINVPTMMVYGPDGTRHDVIIGAPEDLHTKLVGAIESLLK